MIRLRRCDHEASNPKMPVSATEHLELCDCGADSLDGFVLVRTVDAEQRPTLSLECLVCGEHCSVAEWKKVIAELDSFLHAVNN